MAEFLENALRQAKSLTIAKQAKVVEARPKHVPRNSHVPGVVSGVFQSSSRKKFTAKVFSGVKIHPGQKGIVINDGDQVGAGRVVALSLPNTNEKGKALMIFDVVGVESSDDEPNCEALTQSPEASLDPYVKP